MRDYKIVGPNPDSDEVLLRVTARDALHALDQYADEGVFARYSDLLDPRVEAISDEEREGLVWQDEQGHVGAIFTNYWVYAIPV